MFSIASNRLTLFIAAISVTLSSQAVQTSQVGGEVKDASGVPLAKATVLFTSPSLQGQRVYVTDETGRFLARLLPPGDYSIQFTKEGYQTLRISQKLALAQSYSPRFFLQPVGNTTIEVVGTLSQMDKSSTTTSSNFNMDQIENLPISRNPEDMLALTPGVVEGASGATADGLDQVRGALSSSNKYLVDGQNVNDSVVGFRRVSIIKDSIQEVQVVVGGISAEYGDVDGSVVNAVTKDGGNEFTGSLRAELQNNKWNAVTPFQERGSIVDKLNHNLQATVGGYLIKDKLWFFISGYKDSGSSNEAIYGGPYAGVPVITKYTDDRLQAKFTWSLNLDNTLSFTYMTDRTQTDNGNNGSGDLASVSNRLNQDSLWSLNWTSLPTPYLALEARVGEKRTGDTKGGLLQGISPIRDNLTYMTFANGVGDSQDGGDHNDNLSADFKATLQWSGAGKHALAMGGNYLRVTRRAQAKLSPTNRVFACYGYNPFDPEAATDTMGGQSTPQMIDGISSNASAFNVSFGFYFNDKWEINKNLNMNIGLRWDKYHAYSEDSPAKTGAEAFAPRLGLKYDIFGDSSWQVALSYCRYNSAPLSLIVNSVSNVGNPTQITYAYEGPGADGIITRANLTNPANYVRVIGYTSPYTTILPSNLRTPHTNESQVSISHGFKLMDRDSFLKLTLVRRDFKDLLISRTGNDGTYTPPSPYDTAGSFYLRAWGNSEDAKRVYKDVELEWGFQGQKLDLQGNITWSSLEGNYQDQYSSSQFFTVVDGKPMYDWHNYNPYGKLLGDVPLRIRMAGNYHWDWSWGTTSVGAIYRFDSGQHVSMTRNLTPAMVNPDLANYNQAWTYPFTQFRDNQRGNVVFNSQAYTDLSLQQDFKVIRFANRGVKAFVKITVTNIFNHQQQTSDGNMWQMPANGLQDPWVRENYPLSQYNFGHARQCYLETGFKF